MCIRDRGGDKIHLPVRELTEKKVIRYEILADPVPMHVSHPGGTSKYTFGNATKWNDISTAGRKYAENSNHLIVAIAHVQLDDEDTVAAYYMDRIDLGNFSVTGRPQFTTGFNHSHLSEGHVLSTELTAPREEVIEAINEAEAVLQAAQQDANVKPKSMDITLETTQPEALETVVTDDYKTTLIPLKEDESPVQFLAEETITIHEMERRRPARPLNKGQSVKISHTFEKDNILYGLPYGTKDTGLWFGIPMDKVISEDELYSWNIPLNQRIAMRSRLSIQERSVVILSKVLSQGTRLRIWAKNKKQGAK
jgi:hypothetical protein